MLRTTAAVIVAGVLAGCATAPDVTLTYYPAKWIVVATVTQTVGCAVDGEDLVSLHSVSATPMYSSDEAYPRQIRIQHLDSVWADSDITMTFTEDGRLKGINQSSTGQGEAIIKAAISAATSLGITSKSFIEKNACAEVNRWGGNKPITLKYEAKVQSIVPNTIIGFEAVSDSKAMYERIGDFLPKFAAVVRGFKESNSGPSYAGTSERVVLLELQKMGFLELEFMSSAGSIGTARIVVPGTATYKLPIPKAALFGKQGFTLTLSEAGAVTSVGYVKTSGSASALNALGALANIDTSAAAAKAAEMKAEADLIAQQQRLVLCQTNREQCK